MTPLQSRQIILASRPAGSVERSNFALETVAVAAPQSGEVQVRNLWMSVDPYMANRFYDRPNYVPPFRLGKPLDGGAVGRVTASAAPGFSPGQLVLSNYGWREAFTTRAERLKRLPDALAPSAYLGVAGITGMTAYVALNRVGDLRADDVVYISAAAGAVGSIACQIAKLKACRVIASAGGADKVAYLRGLGVDHVIDYKSEALAPALSKAAPDGLSLYLDNVGGDHLQAALANMRDFGRVVICGMIGSYSDAPRPGPSNLFEIVSRQLSIRGFLLSTYEAEVATAFERDMSAWISSGAVRADECVMKGLDAAPEAFMGMMAGVNIGKMLVNLAD